MEYTYNILNDFPNQKVDYGSLETEILSSVIGSTYEYINGNNIDVFIYFNGALTQGGENILDNIIANHQGNPIKETQVIKESIDLTESLFVQDTSVVSGVEFTLAAIDASGKLVDTGIEGISAVQALSGNIVHGTQFHLAQSLASSTTSSKSPQIKCSLTTTNLPQGKYKIDVSWVAMHNSNKNDMNFDVTLNGTTIGGRGLINVEPRDINSYFTFKRAFYEDLVGVNTIQLRYWNESNSTTISDANIEMIRVL